MVRTTLLLFCLQLPAVWAQGPTPQSLRSPRPQSWILDQANVLSPEQEARLDAQLTKLEKTTGAEMAIVTLQDTDGREPKAYATVLFNHWGLGKRNVNNGMLFLVVMGRRRMEVEVGDGLRGPIPDQWVPGMLTRVVVPRFRSGRAHEGIAQGVQELIARVPHPRPRVRQDLGGLWSTREVLALQTACDQAEVHLVVEKKGKPTVKQAETSFAQQKLGERGWLLQFNPDSGQVVSVVGSGLQAPMLRPITPGKKPRERAVNLLASMQTTLRAQTAAESPPARPVAAPVSLHGGGSGPQDWPDGTPWMVLLGTTALGLAAYYWSKYHRQRNCPNCRSRLYLIDDAEDDAHLTTEEHLEERISSMDHQVWACNGCDFSKKEAWNAWFSGYGRCPSCQRRTLKTESRTIRAATYDSSGEGLRIQDCVNCSYHNESTYHISRKTRPSSSSSSSSGSTSGSGGGRSSGGGGGASW